MSLDPRERRQGNGGGNLRNAHPLDSAMQGAGCLVAAFPARGGVLDRVDTQRVSAIVGGQRATVATCNPLNDDRRRYSRRFFAITPTTPGRGSQYGAPRREASAAQGIAVHATL